MADPYIDCFRIYIQFMIHIVLVVKSFYPHRNIIITDKRAIANANFILTRMERLFKLKPID